MSERTEHLFRFWGRDAEQAVAMLPRDVHVERERDDGCHVAWFASAEVRDAYRQQLRGLLVVHDPVDGPPARTCTVVDVHLRHDGRDYRYTQSFGFGYPESAARYMYEDGNYACDDNRSAFIQRYCDPTFPDIAACGDTITLVALHVRLVEDCPA